MTSAGHRGFTLIELVITVAIVAILAAIAVPSYKKHIQKSNRAVAKVVLTQIVSREEAFFADRKVYATTMAGLGYPVDGNGLTYIDRDGTAQSTNNSDRIYSIGICASGTGTCANATTSEVWFVATPVNGQNSPVEQCGLLLVSTSGNKSQVSPSGQSPGNCWKM